MKFGLAYLAIATLIDCVHALPSPLSKRQAALNQSDVSLLDYALALENLQNAFYMGALQRFNEADFAAAGYNAFARGRFVQISEHEQAHVDLLNATIGPNASKPCNYTFPYTNVQSFAAFSQVLENIATAAYIGAMQNITSPEQLSVAASILSTEARHAAWVASVPNKFSPWSGPFDTGLTPNQTFTLIKTYLASCPENNPPGNLFAFPTLNVSRGLPGSNVTFTFDPSLANSLSNSSSGANGTQLYAVFLSGLSRESMPLYNSDGSPLVAGGAGGTTPTPSPTPTSSVPSTSASESSTSTTSSASESTSTTSSASESPTSTSSEVISAVTSVASQIPTTAVQARWGGGAGGGGSGNTTSSAASPTSTGAPGSGLTGMVAVPQNLKGQVYAFVSSDEMMATDQTIVAGPAVLVFEFDSAGNVTVQSQPPQMM